MRVLRLEPKGVREPGGAVVGALEFDLITMRRHVGEQAVLIGNPEGFQEGDGAGRQRIVGKELIQQQKRSRVGDARQQNGGERDTQGANHLARMTAQADVGPRCGRGAFRFGLVCCGRFRSMDKGRAGTRCQAGAPALRDKADQGPVVQQKEAKHKDKVVEKRVVGGGDHADLPNGDYHETRQAPGPGQNGKEDEDQLHDQGEAGGEAMEPERQVLQVPADPGRERTVLIVLVHRGQVAPGGVA